jgi:hypothetical protein
MKLVIDLDQVFNMAMENMSEENDIRWPLGAALEQLYFYEGIEQLQQKMIKQFKLNEGN